MIAHHAAYFGMDKPYMGHPTCPGQQNLPCMDVDACPSFLALAMKRVGLRDREITWSGSREWPWLSTLDWNAISLANVYI
jgi:hypothetical protein